MLQVEEEELNNEAEDKVNKWQKKRMVMRRANEIGQRKRTGEITSEEEDRGY